MRRLSVFVGGFSLAAAQSLATTAPEGPAEQSPYSAAAPADVAAVLDALVAESLVRPLPAVAGEDRFGLLDTVREFALEQLVAEGEAYAAEGAQAEYLAGLAEASMKGLQTPNLDPWLQRLDAEQGNIRRALAWCLGAGDAAATGLRIVGSLRIYWDLRGLLEEGRQWLDRALAEPDAAADLRRNAHNAAGLLAWRHGDHEAARAHYGAALELARQAGDRLAEAGLISNLGILAHEMGEFATARAYFEQSLAMVRESGDPTRIGIAINNIGATYSAEGDLLRARQCFQDAIVLYRQGGDQQLLVDAIENVAIADGDLGHIAAAIAGLDEVLAVRRARGERTGTATTLTRLSGLHLVDGRPDIAARLVRESLGLHREVGDVRGLIDAVDQTVALLGWPFLRPMHRQPPRVVEAAIPSLDDLAAATRLAAAALARRRADHVAPTLDEERAQRANLAALQAALGRGAYAAAWATGEALGLDGAVAEALAALDAQRFRSRAEPAGRSPGDPGEPAGRGPVLVRDDGGLTPRELEVAILIGEGLSYREMAERLSVSVKAIEKHVGNILAKLGARNRREVATWARARGLGGGAPGLG